jgi:hypothetical protein
MLEIITGGHYKALASFSLYLMASSLFCFLFTYFFPMTNLSLSYYLSHLLPQAKDQYNCHLTQQRKVNLRSHTLFWFTCTRMVQTIAVVPGAWVMAQVLFTHLHGQSEVDSHKGYE